MIEFSMPSLGADMEDGTLVEWRVKVGDKVERGDIIAEVDTQKGLIEIEVFDEGIIHQLMIKEEEKVPVGTIMALILPPEEKVTNGKSNMKVEPEVKVVPAEIITKKEPIKKLVHEASKRIKISPLARIMAEEKNIDIATLKGTGPEGSIVKQDIEKAIKLNGDGEVKRPQSKEKKEEVAKTVRLAIAAAMSKSNKEIPHFYLETKINLTKALDWLEEANRKRAVKDRLLMVVLLIKATAKALKKVPEMNAYWEGELKLKEAVNIGFSVSLRSGGVVVPAVRDADQKSIDELMRILNDLIPRAKTLKLRSSELSESTITLTNLGEGNADKVFGVIYPPQVTIIGFGSITEQPWAENKAVSVRPVISVTLGVDHRAIDGRLGSKFIAAINDNLQKPEEL